MFKVIAVIGNLTYLGYIIYMTYEKGLPGRELQILAMVGIIITALCSLIVILKTPKEGGDENIIALWLKVKKANLRKQLEG
jgi:hypothetical protein